MKEQNDLIDQLIRHEGLRLKPYKDTVGKMTIGVGRNLDDVGITDTEAMMMLQNDVTRVRQQLSKQLPFIDRLPYSVQNVLINMAFNMGVGGLSQFKKFLTYLAEGKFIEASVEMLDSRWAKQVGARAIELSNTIKEAK